MKSFVHLSDAERRAALDAVRLAADAFGRIEIALWTDRDQRRSNLEVVLEPVGGDWQFATLHRQAALLALSFRAGFGASPHRVAVYQPGAWRDALDTHLVNATLADWSSLLDAVADEQDRSVMEAARSAHAEILQAAADAFDPRWTHSSLSPGLSGVGGHAFVHGGRSGNRTRFAQGEATRKQGGMTGDLQRLLERAADPFLHVTGYRGGQPWSLRVTIGGPPEIVIENRRDPMATIRRLAALPEDARFIAPVS